MSHQRIVILDFGSQYTQLIARRIRELGVYSEILPYHDYSAAKSPETIGIILSGGPSSVLADDSPEIPAEILDYDRPILGICYGMQLIAKMLGADLRRTTTREYGRSNLKIDSDSPIFKGLPRDSVVWMSHGDHVDSLPEGTGIIASTETLDAAAIENSERNFYGLQFHPEVAHTEQGKAIIENFIYRICGATGDWSMASFIESQVKEIRERVGENEGVVLGLSGGVDSAVTAALLGRAVGNRLYPVFVNNGLLRLNEADEVRTDYAAHFPSELIYIDATERFLGRLTGIVDPEAKRKIIGNIFIDVFTDAVSHINDVKYLAQGTLYPDVIESVSTRGPSATIKSHHNVGGLPEKLGFELIEPLRELFKDEVRELGRELGLPENILERHPFPGPGLAVRIVGEITAERLDVLRRGDHIFIEELKNSGEYDRIWQAFAVLLPVQSVGVMGDERTYENVLALRAVTSRDGMTADWARIPPKILARSSTRIINEVTGINRVCYDISSKPPATIEWE